MLTFMSLPSLAEVFLSSFFPFVYYIQWKDFTENMPQYFNCIHAVFSIWHNISPIEICYFIFKAHMK